MRDTLSSMVSCFLESGQQTVFAYLAMLKDISLRESEIEILKRMHILKRPRCGFS